MASTQSSSSTTTTQIPWPLLPFALLILSLNTMIQPSGRLCGHHRLRRTYLISSPIMCLYDILFVLIYPIYIRNKYSVNIVTGITLLLSERFSAPVPNEKFHALVQRTWLRWLFFMLGPLPMGILLMSCEGIPWTQILAMLFLADWLVGEVLLYLSTTTRFSPGEHENVPDMPQLMTYTGYSFVGFTILLWTILLWLPILDLDISQPSIGLAVNILFLAVIPIGLAWILAIGPEVLGLGRFLERQMMLSQWLCVAFPDADGYYFLDTGAWHYAVVFLANILLGILAYAIYYNPTGTALPVWLGTS